LRFWNYSCVPCLEAINYSMFEWCSWISVQK
jgi:hypothetical protein